MRRLSLFLATILLLLSLACDDDNNDSGNGDDPTNGTPDPTPTIIPVPENLSSDETSSTDGAYELSWDEVTGASTYKLREGEDTELELSSDDVQSRTHSVTGKETGSYDYQVQACDASGTCSEWSDAITVHVFTAMAPTLTLSDETRATDGAYRSRDGLYTLTWNSRGEGITYELREEEDTELSLTSPIATTYSVTTAKMNGSYSYYVRACHTNGVCSDWSDAVMVHVFTASAPTWTSTETKSGNGSYTLRWTEVSGAASYELEEVIRGGSNMPLSLDPNTPRAHSISGKTDGSYSYQVRACDANNICTPWSELSVLVIIDCEARPTEQSTGFHDGDGSKGNPYLICSYPQLKKMGDATDADSDGVPDALTKHYKLGKDIDARESRRAAPSRSGAETCTPYNGMSEEDDDPGDAGNGATCTGWTPVGTNTNPFTGSLQGAGYEIQNLYINIKTATAPVALFARTGGASLIQNVGLTDADIRVEPTAFFVVGGLVGHNQGSISNSYTTGSIAGDGNLADIGGLVGYNAGDISNSYTTSSIAGGGLNSRVGGLVGHSQGSISNSYATGSITATGGGLNSYVGGLVGHNNGSISNSYATGTVKGGSRSNVGGLVGHNDRGSNVNISNSYASGSVTGGSRSNVGGLVGNNGGSISNSYATGTVKGGSRSNVGGLVGWNNGSITGTNYFVADASGTDGVQDGVHTGSCGASASVSASVCIRAGDTTTTMDEERKTWLKVTLDESTPNDARPAGLGWSDTNWGDFVGMGVGYPKLKYAQVAAFCSASPTTLTTPELCLAAGSCSGGTGSDRDACVEDDGMWTPTNAWLAGDDECGGTTGVVCGNVIPGQ